MHNVVIAAYNAEPHIAEAIESVLGQTYDDLKIVVINDGSTDGTLQIIEEFSDPRIHVISQANAGQAKAWEAASRHIAYTGLVFLLDADDLMLPNRVEVIDEVYRQHLLEQGERISLIQHSIELFGSDGAALEEQPYTIPQDSTKDPFEWYEQEKVTGSFYPTTGLCVPSQLFAAMFPLETDWKICADAFLTRKLGFYGNTISLSECLGRYRVHGNNHWFGTDSHEEKLKNQRHFAEYINALLDAHGRAKVTFRIGRPSRSLLGRVKGIIKRIIRRK